MIEELQTNPVPLWLRGQSSGLGIRGNYATAHGEGVYGRYLNRPNFWLLLRETGSG